VDPAGGLQTPRNAALVGDLLGFEPQPQTSREPGQPYALYVV